MLVNPINKKHLKTPKQRPNLEKFSYEQFLKNQQPLIQELPIQILPLIMDNLDFDSSARFLMTYERLNKTYGNPEINRAKGIALSPEAYMREMIKASRLGDEKRVGLLIKRESKRHTEQRKSILQCFDIDCSDLAATMTIYKKKYDSKCNDFMKTLSFFTFEDLVENQILCQLSLEQGLSPNVYDTKYDTLLMRRIYKGNSEAIKILLKNEKPEKTDPNIQNKDGKTALMIAVGLMAIKFDRIGAIKILLADTKTKPNIQDKDGKTALMIAAECNYIEALKLLLADTRVDPNIQDTYGRTVLMRAVKKNHIETLKLLLADERVDQNTAFYAAHYYMKDSKLVNELFSRASYWKSLLRDPFASGLGYLNLDKESIEFLEKNGLLSETPLLKKNDLSPFQNLKPIPKLDLKPIPKLERLF